MKTQKEKFKLSSFIATTIVATTFFFYSSSVEASDKKASTESHHTEAKSTKKKKSKVKDNEAEEITEEKPIGAEEATGNQIFDKDLAAGGKIDAVILLDSSRSMLRTDPQRLRDQAAKLFLRFLTPGDRVAIFQFDREVRTVLSFTEISNETLPSIDTAINGVLNEGGFTDLAAPIVSAKELLITEGRPDVSKTIILLSDGKMDPHPANGTSIERTAELREKELPQFKEKKLSIYTVSLSEESDKELLSAVAVDGNGLNWFAPDASTIHKKFSELFLTLKRPQVVPLDAKGFEIDSGIQEATFYLSRQQAPAPELITLVDPKSTEFNSSNVPAGMRWFRGDLFEVITVPQPLPGRWGIKGIENAEGFATLLTDIKLQVRWPQTTLKLGDKVAFFARLTNKGENVEKSGLEEITFYTYKIISTANAATVVSGSLNDKGEEDDEKAGDGIYTGSAKLDKEGDYQALFAVTSPTFTRQQRISFSVSAGLVNLKIIPADEFAGTHEKLVVEVSNALSAIKERKIQLIANKLGEKKALGITLTAEEEHSNQYEVPIEKLPAGEYQLYAKLTGEDPKSKGEDKKFSASSESISYTVHNNAVEIEIEEEEEGESDPWIIGLVCILLSAAWMTGVGYFGLSRITPGKGNILSRKPFQPTPEFLKRIEVIRERSSNQHRPPSDVDMQYFSIVQDVYGGQTVVVSKSDVEESDGTNTTADEETAQTSESDIEEPAKVGDEAATDTLPPPQEEKPAEETPQ